MEIKTVEDIREVLIKVIEDLEKSENKKSTLGSEKFVPIRCKGMLGHCGTIIGYKVERQIK